MTSFFPASLFDLKWYYCPVIVAVGLRLFPPREIFPIAFQNESWPDLAKRGRLAGESTLLL